MSNSTRAPKRATASSSATDLSETGVLPRSPVRPRRFVEAAVLHCVPEFHHVEVMSADEELFVVGKATKGVDWSKLFEGQVLECTVTDEAFPKVIFARVLV